MRVLHLLASRGAGGAEILVRDLAIELQGRNVEVGIAFISRAVELKASPKFEAGYQQLLKDASVQTFDLGHDCRRNPLMGALRLNAILRRFRPDILHVHLEYGLLYRLLLWPRKITTVYTHHIDHFRRGKATFRILSLTVDHVVAISRQAESLLRSVAGVRVTRIMNAARFRIQDSSGPAEARFGVQVLSVGGLHPQKNYQRLIRIVAGLLKQRPQLSGRVRFLIAGDGPERPLLERQIAQLGLGPVISLLGTRSDVHDLMGRSDLLLMTSDYEGLPITLLEALHAGLPIVATDVGGVSEVVDHGENGLLAPAADERALADHIFRLIDEPELRTGFGQRSLQMAQQFSIEESAERHLTLYRALLLSKPAGRAEAQIG
jgi:glycosyltransferase involved in cell wall biosynthesis